MNWGAAFLIGVTFLVFGLRIYRNRELIKTNLRFIKTWIDIKAKER